MIGGIGWGRIPAAILLALVLTGAGPAPVSTGDSRPLGELPKPRELSEAERAAVELAVAYLQRGPEAWGERLASTSPLRRLERKAALEEIGVRAGPASDAVWQLLTPGPKLGPGTAVFGIELASGLDEILILHLVDEGGWKVDDLRISAEPTGAPAPPPASPSKARSAPPPPTPAPVRPRAWLPLALFALGLAGAAGSLLLARTGKKVLALGAGAATVVAGVAIGLWMWLAAPSVAVVHAARPAPAPAVKVGILQLASLAPLRQALAEGGDRAEIEKQLATPLVDPALREVQTLWRAQYRLLESDLKAVDAALAGIPSAAKAPLADLIRARLAFRRLQPEPTRELYSAAIDGGLDVDTLHLESAFAESLTDQEELARGEIAQLTEAGSRMGVPWYMAARQAAAEGQIDQAEDLLLRAWHLEPAARAELFDDPAAAFLLTRPKLFPAFQISAAEEPRLPPEGTRRPLLLPAGVQAVTCGQALRLAAGTAELLVPGGAGLVPADTPIEDARTWGSHSDEKALVDLPSLTRGVAPGETLPPRQLNLAQRAGSALAEQNRWSELVTLTQPLVADIEHAPTELVRLRAQALQQMDRRDEARQLLIRLAKSDFAGRRPAAGTLLALSELFAAAGEYDTAIRLSEKADRQLPAPRGGRRRKQLAMDRDLAASYGSYRSEHFEVRYPKATGERYARGVTTVLEQERHRLERWIPGAGSKPVEVHIFPARDFFDNFGGDMGVVGLFDGKVRVPFAEVRSLHPRLVAILSHELAHAMIAAATHDQAPHWFQEGMAQHIEMGHGRLNPLPDLTRTGRVLAFPTIDPILRGFAEPQLVDLAYGEAAWTINFIEARYGMPALHRLLAAYAAGKTTDQALKEVAGLSPVEFDRAFQQWGSTQAPQARDIEVERYDLEVAVQEQRAQQKDVRSILRLGMSEEARKTLARQQEEVDDLRRRMAAWHTTYAARAEEVKLAFKPIVQRYREAARININPGCTALSSAAPKMSEDDALWTSPDPRVNDALRTAYRALADVGRACLAGRENELSFLVVEAERHLDTAAKLLAPYGLAP